MATRGGPSTSKTAVGSGPRTSVARVVPRQLLSCASACGGAAFRLHCTMIRRSKRRDTLAAQDAAPASDPHRPSSAPIHRAHADLQQDSRAPEVGLPAPTTPTPLPHGDRGAPTTLYCHTHSWSAPRPGIEPILRALGNTPDHYGKDEGGQSDRKGSRRGYSSADSTCG